MTILELQEVSSGYGAIEVLKGISLQIPKGKITSIIGANGAGKSTLLRTVFGLIKPTRGKVLFEGEDITGFSPRKILHEGISYVPQGRCNFPDMTVRENLEMSAYIRNDEGVQKDIDTLLERFPILGGRVNEMAGNLSGGQQQILEMAMALLLQPSLMMIDEPSLGLAPQLVHMVFDKIQDLNEDGMTIVMVEQNAKRALALSDHAAVLELGKVALEGTGEEILNNEDVRRHYLGGSSLSQSGLGDDKQDL